MTYWFKKGCQKEADDPVLTVLNFSAGKQSSALLWMVLRGDLRPRGDFLVLRADPGMENSKTYEYAEFMRQRCKEEGINYAVAPGPNLYEDLINLDDATARLDNPPYWTKDEKGKIGRLRQKCTRHYKIAPMDRYIRQYLEDNHGISSKSSHLGCGIVEKWIGFTLDEAHRIKPPKRKYIRFYYPLIEKQMKKVDTLEYFKRYKLPIPPRSVCNACFANGLDTLEEMYYNRPDDWQQAVNVDRAVRDLSPIGVHDEVFVSHTGQPLEELARQGFTKGVDKDDWSCDSGYCFL